MRLLVLLVEHGSNSECYRGGGNKQHDRSVNLQLSSQECTSDSSHRRGCNQICEQPDRRRYSRRCSAPDATCDRGCPLPEVSAGADAVKEVAFGVVLLDDSAYAAVQNGALTLDEVSRAFVDGITGVKPLDVGHASGWIGLLMLLMLIAAYTGDAPLIASRRRSVAVVSAMFDEALSLRRLGRRRYALAAAAAALALVGLVGSDFVPVYPTTLGFAALMLIAAIDPLAGVAAGVVGFAAV
ncbi:MAG: hypothetical protein EB111_02660, partial [Actinobacteria bacterium]|nr:hypothetical protein [Actinomycetota bacterium]